MFILKENKFVKFAATALVAAVICGCGQIEINDPVRRTEEICSSDYRIVFDAPVVAPSTKALSVTKSSPYTTERNAIYGSLYPTNWPIVVASVYYTGTFAETGWQEDNIYFNPSEHFYAEDGAVKGWTCNYYWPKINSYKLAFAAYSPKINSASYTGATIGENGIKFLNYTLATDGTQKDLMYSNRTVDQAKSSYTHNTASAYDGVQLVFNHALSSIVFNVKTAQDIGEAIIRLQKIELMGVKTEGSFSQNLSTTEISNSLASWTIPASAATVDYSNIVDTEGVLISDEAILSSECEGIGDLLVLPQNFGDAQIKITYQLQMSAEGAAVPQHYTFRLADLSYSLEESDPIVGYNSFEMGKRYVFNVEIGLKKISFQPYITYWESHIVIP